MSKPILYYKEATPVSLNATLLSHPHFAEHWKVIPSVVKCLNHILRWNDKDNGFSSITYHYFYNRFRDDYTTIIRALDTLDLLRIDRVWIKNTKCYDYYITPKCQRLLADTNKEYLYLLLTDKATKRRNQKQISGRKHKVYGDIRDILKDGLDNISVDLNQIDEVVATMPAGKQAFVWSLLIDIVRKDYGDLRHNEKDNRIWTPYAQLPAEIRAIIKVKGLEYQQTIDIRSCYPSLLAEYICQSYPHIDAAKTDMERKRWNDLFLDPHKDPKAVIAKAIGVCRQDIKEIMIQYFNGKIRGKAFRAFDKWISSEYPTLYDAWKRTNIKQTGNNIGKYFETRLMLDKSIYKRAKQLGIVIGYEYDGMSFYAKDDRNCQALLDYIEQRSIELLGVKLVFVDKTDLLSIPQMAIENNLRHLEATHTHWVKICRRTFRKGATPDWESFREEQECYWN